ncbi:MAG: FAD-binding oxidoreductase [Pseudomonadota bacterium]
MTSADPAADPIYGDRTASSSAEDELPGVVRLVQRLPRDSGVCGWNALLPAPGPARMLEDDITADWVVIGAGWAGLAAARRLTQLAGGDRIVILEAGRIGEGPAGRNSGFMIDLPHKLQSNNYAGQVDADRRQTLLNRAAIAFAAEAAEEYGLDAEAFARTGKINAAATRRGMAQNQAYAAHLASLSEPHKLLDAGAMQGITGSSYYRSGLYTPGTALVQPAKFVRGVAKGLAGKVSLYETTPATEIARRGRDWRLATPKGSVAAPRVILAVNGHLESFGYMARRLVHIHLYASMTRALTESEKRALGGEPRWGLTPADPAGSTVRRIESKAGTRVIMRNSMTYDPGMETSEVRVTRLGRRHDRSLAARFPALAGVEMDHRWGGRLCLSLNDAPVFGEIEEGVFSACVQNGLGTTKGTIAGKLAADLAAQGNDPLVAELLAEDQPTRLPPKPLSTLGAVATMRWRQWWAGREV